MREEAFDLSILDPDKNTGYGMWPLPCARDEEILALMRSLEAANTPQKLQTYHGPVLVAFAERMSTLSRREGSLDRLRAGLKAVCLALSLGDRREALGVLPLLWRSAEKLGLGGEKEFRSAAEDKNCSAILISFAKHEPYDRSLEAMGYVEVDDEAGFRYKRTW